MAPNCDNNRPFLAAPLRYSSVAIFLHWLIALGILLNLALAWAKDTFASSAPFLVRSHECVGLTIFVLVSARLIWRLRNPPPRPLGDPGWETKLRWMVHKGLYVVMFSMPVSGLLTAITSSKAVETELFGDTPIAKIRLLPFETISTAHLVFAIAHWVISNVLYALLLLHFAGALRAQARGQRALQRMWF